MIRFKAALAPLGYLGNIKPRDGVIIILASFPRVTFAPRLIKILVPPSG